MWAHPSRHHHRVRLSLVPKVVTRRARRAHRFCRRTRNTVAGSRASLTTNDGLVSGSRSTSSEVRLERRGEGRVTVADCCRALRVSPSGFYAWQQRPESPGHP